MNLNLILKYFTPRNILDIGVHRGQFYNNAKIIFTEASFFLIEGNTSCEPYIKELNVPYLIRVLGREKGLGVFYKTISTDASSGESLYREITPIFSEENIIKEKVQIHTLNDIFSTEVFDLIKVDTQGSEIDILKGGSRIINHAKGIILEVSIERYNEGAPLYNDVVKFMDSIGFYEAERLDEVNFVTDFNLKVHQQDILFIKKNS